MSFQAMAWAYSQKVPDAECKLILMALANYAGHDNSCWPAIPRLARECILSERTIQRRIKDLADISLIKIDRRKTPQGDFDSHVFILNITAQACSDYQSPPPDRESPGRCQGVTTGGDWQSPKPIIKEPINEPVPPTPYARGHEPNPKEVLAMVQEFWKAYPRKSNMPDTEHAFAEVKAYLCLPTILKALEWQKCSEQWLRDNGRYIPMPARYLRDMLWKDEPVNVAPVNHQQKESMKRSAYIQKLCSQPLPE